MGWVSSYHHLLLTFPSEQLLYPRAGIMKPAAKLVVNYWPSRWSQQEEEPFSAGMTPLLLAETQVDVPAGVIFFSSRHYLFGAWFLNIEGSRPPGCGVSA